MNLKHANVLITGGSEGIGRGLAARFLAAGSNVLITGRNPTKLARASRALPGLRTYLSDISDPQQREALAEHVHETMPGLNVLINNAGIQRRVSLALDIAPWSERQAEIDTLLSGPIHLNHLLVPLILAHGKSAIVVNVTSGGAYIPQVFAPVYSACKAAIHHYTMTLRHSLMNTPCRVVELIPPAVQTALAGAGLSHGVPLDEFCDAVFSKLLDDNITEIGFGPTENLIPQLSGKPLTSLFEASASRSPVETYSLGLPGISWS
jgi:uncharacterized oxidoreductase